MYASWGKSVQHVIRDGEKTTCCGKPAPEKVRLSIYKGRVCTRCTKADPEAVALAEAWRLRQFGNVAERLREEREAAQAGRFQVFRCRVCGAQVSGKRGTRVCIAPGVKYHDTDPEEVEAIGPAWTAPA